MYSDGCMTKDQSAIPVPQKQACWQESPDQTSKDIERFEFPSKASNDKWENRQFSKQFFSMHKSAYSNTDTDKPRSALTLSASRVFSE